MAYLMDVPLALEVSGKIGVGTIITAIIVVAGVVSLFWKMQQGDPSEWRENYLGEVTRREEVEAGELRQRELKHEALTELAALRARTDLAPLMEAIVGLSQAQQKSEDRMTTVLASFEQNQRQTTEILSSLVEQVHQIEHRAAA